MLPEGRVVLGRLVRAWSQSSGPPVTGVPRRGTQTALVEQTSVAFTCALAGVVAARRPSFQALKKLAEKRDGLLQDPDRFL